MDANSGRSEIKAFTVVVKKIERYMIVPKLEFANSMDTHDMFDLTLSTISRQLKCLLHPNLNKHIYHGRLQISSVIQVNGYDMHIDETETESKEFLVIKSFTVLEEKGSSISSLDNSFFKTDYVQKNPLISCREYYLPFYNDEDIYGRIWNSYLKQMNTITLDTAITSIQNLSENKSNTQLLPVTGTVITKSKLTYFGKQTDVKKFSMVFSIEIEHNDWTCSVSFWNRSCLNYFKNIEIGQNIVLKNYRLKCRYGNRSNTVFGLSNDAGIELSINPAKPKGEVHLLDKPASRIIYK